MTPEVNPVLSPLSLSASSLSFHTRSSRFFFAKCKIRSLSPLPRSSHSLLLAERLGLRVEGPVADVEEEEADGEDDARVLVDDVDVLDAGQRLLHHARPAFELKQREMSAMK